MSKESKSTKTAVNEEAFKKRIDALAQELSLAHEKTQKAEDQLLRALADVENTRKRLERERQESRQFSAETVLRKLLPITDSLDQALKNTTQAQAGDAFYQGMALIQKQIEDLMKAEGLERMKTVGTLFDPHKHEAVMHIEAEKPEDDHKIVEELQCGYLMHGKVIRSAMVKIAKTAQSQ